MPTTPNTPPQPCTAAFLRSRLVVLAIEAQRLLDQLLAKPVSCWQASLRLGALAHLYTSLGEQLEDAIYSAERHGPSARRAWLAEARALAEAWRAGEDDA